MFRICGSGSHAFRFTVASSLALATSAFAFASTPTRDDIPVHKLACNLMPNVSSRGKPCVLIACGSFNPPTLTHLRMFEAARDELRKVTSPEKPLFPHFKLPVSSLIYHYPLHTVLTP